MATKPAANPCYNCGRNLTNPVSVEEGIGPVCRGKRKKALTKEQEFTNKATRCLHGYNCFNPEHAGTLLARVKNSMEVATGTVTVEAPDRMDLWRHVLNVVTGACQIINDSLGLGQPVLALPEVDTSNLLPNFNHNLSDLLEKAVEIKHDGTRADWVKYYHADKLRRLELCPFGLRCKSPDRAVAAVYHAMAVLRRDGDRVFTRTHYGGIVTATDGRPFKHFAGILSVLGIDDEAAYILEKDLPAYKKRDDKRGRRRRSKGGTLC